MSKVKKTFELGENETIDECLERMKVEGYTPIRRIEKPIFLEEKANGKPIYTPIKRKIIFEGKKDE
ncbi:hypothetical protein J2S13_002005 [Oikeobacillus pervagus]|uniref:NETI motif-containing protein n=1 Tax=Oikeobacillus pervagus TaxID=1325931 RepID=A0AAJ1T2H2_9BACI|nr:NETI motif-containing protein [Oikeobacillus pervagus]MDQ0215587.1 hypothetical protein [Oikeobacillus pervagus]